MKQFFFALTFVFVHTSISLAQLANAPWPMFQQNQKHTGRSVYSGPQSEPTLLWEFHTGAR